MGNKSISLNQDDVSDFLLENINQENISNSEIIIKNFFDVINNKSPVKYIGKVKSLAKMIQSVNELEKDGILDTKEARVLIEFVVQKFIESKFDKILEGLQIDNNYNWFLASSRYLKQ